MRIPSLLALATTLLATSPLQASGLIGYWDVNNTLDRTAGVTGDLSKVMMIEAGLGGKLDFGPDGTTLNATPGHPAGQSIRFSEFIGVIVIGEMTFSNLDLREFQAPTLSFALRKSEAVVFFSHFWVDYRIGSGSWHTATTFVEEESNEYELYSHTFDPGLIDGQNHVSLRVSFREIMTIASAVQFDNFQIRANAIPEPGSIALLGVAALAMGGAVLRRQRKL